MAEENEMRELKPLGDEAPLYAFEAHVNRRNIARCAMYTDRIVLETKCTGGFLPVFDNRRREIPIAEIERVVISTRGKGIFPHHPNAVHFVVAGSNRTVDEMYRDPGFRASAYIDQGVCQFAPNSNVDLTEKVQIAGKMKEYIEAQKKKGD